MMNTTASRRPCSPYFCSRSSSSFAAASPTTLRSIAMRAGYQLRLRGMASVLMGFAIVVAIAVVLALPTMLLVLL